MPISRSKFESGELDPSLFLVEFLRSNPDYAYTMEELIEKLASKGIDLTAEKVESILRLLESRGRIESKMKYGVVYYIYSKRIGFRPS